MLNTQVIGRIGEDATMRKVNDGTVIKFSVAHNSKYIDKKTGEIVENVTWLNCFYWRKKESNLLKYLVKGQELFVTGIPKPQLYIDKNGNPHVDFSLTVEKLEFVGSKPSSPENQEKPTLSTNKNEAVAQEKEPSPDSSPF